MTHLIVCEEFFGFLERVIAPTSTPSLKGMLISFADL